MNSELVIPEGNKKTLAELVGVSIELSGSDNNNNKRSKVSTLARLNLTGKAIMGVKNIEGKDMNLEVIPAGAYELEQDDGIKVYCINPIIRVLTYREQWGRFDVENNKPNKSIKKPKNKIIPIKPVSEMICKYILCGCVEHC